MDLLKVAIAVGVGAADEVAEYMDRNAKNAAGVLAPRTESFKNATDLTRIGLAAIGYGLQVFMPRKYDRIAEALALSTTPLVVKSVAKPLMVQMGIKESYAVNSFRPMTSVPAAREFTRSYAPEAQGARIL